MNPSPDSRPARAADADGAGTAGASGGVGASDNRHASGGGASGHRHAVRARHSGRRPGRTDTRQAVLEAARAEFAEAGYECATIRGIAARAGVDPALVHHYFGAKETLFRAALELPLRPADAVSQGLAAGRDQLGATVVRRFLEAWEPAETRVRLKALFRSAMTNDAAMQMTRELVIREVFDPITRALGVPDARLRATLVASQLMGLAMLRYVSCLEPLASASIDDLVAAIGPTLQRYLTGAIG